jgi:hypothetical protein
MVRHFAGLPIAPRRGRVDDVPVLKALWVRCT